MKGIFSYFAHMCAICFLFQISREFEEQLFVVTNRVFSDLVQYEFLPQDNDQVRL